MIMIYKDLCCDARANRGGSYNNAASNCRLAGNRNNNNVPNLNSNIGLRLLLYWNMTLMKWENSTAI